MQGPSFVPGGMRAIAAICSMVSGSRRCGTRTSAPWMRTYSLSSPFMSVLMAGAAMIVMPLRL